MRAKYVLMPVFLLCAVGTPGEARITIPIQVTGEEHEFIIWAGEILLGLFVAVFIGG